jgi:tetratricopeptide (TPR) repeat protein
MAAETKPTIPTTKNPFSRPVIGRLLGKELIMSLILRGDEPAQTRPDAMNQTSQDVVSTPPPEHDRARELLSRRRYADALLAAEQLLAEKPASPDALFLVAVSLRHLSKIPEALEALQQLGHSHRESSRVHEERGYCYVELRDAPKAIGSFERSVEINPSLETSWAMLESLYRMTGDARNAGRAGAQLAALKQLPPQVLQASKLLLDGLPARAEEIVKEYLSAARDDVAATRLLARISIELDRMEEAERLLEAALRISPDHRQARYEYACVLIERHKYHQATRALDELLKLEPADRQYRAAYAAAHVGVGAHEQAIEVYAGLIAEESSAELLLSLGHVLKTVGRLEDSIAAYRSAAALGPLLGEAYWSLANLRTYRFSDEEIEHMRAAESAPETALVPRYHFSFALAKALEDRAKYEESWHCYERGNALRRSQSIYRPEIVEAATRRQIEICTREFFQRRAGSGSPSADPIFIVGLPRSGSTLLEQILASHSRVEGTQELPYVPNIVRDLTAQRGLEGYPGALESLAPSELERLGERYLREARAHRTDKPYFIDKMPNNFRFLDLIHLMLPNAKIIDARRHPIACCLSNLKQLFAAGQEFAYRAEDVARYYRAYLDLMGHWDTALPGRVLRVVYEDLVDDLGAAARRVLSFCGLEFEPACLEFYKTRRSIRTASSEQVRQAIFREGIEQWKHFDPWLGPLKEALGDALVRYRS